MRVRKGETEEEKRRFYFELVDVFWISSFEARCFNLIFKTYQLIQVLRLR